MVFEYLGLILQSFVVRGTDCYVLLSCQPRETVASCFVYKVIRDLESIYQFPLSQVECPVNVLLNNCIQSITSLSLLVGTTVCPNCLIFKGKYGTIKLLALHAE